MLDNPEGTSVREDIMAAFKDSEVVAEDTPETPSAEPVASSESEPTPKSDESKPTTVHESKPESKADPAKAATDAEEKAIEPPARWTKEEKEEFAGLDPKIQKILLNRNKGLEATFTRQMQEISQERQRYQGIDQVLAPHRQSWAGTGWSDAQALGTIMGYWQHAQQDPLGFVQRFAEERGIDLASHFAPSTDEILAYLNQQQGGGYDEQGNPLPSIQAPAIHPDVKRELETLKQTNQRLMQAVQQQQGYWSQAQQSQTKAAYDAASQDIEAFRNATDETGKPKHEFFDDLRQDMAKLMKAGITDTLEDAYDRAMYMRPDIRAKLQESQELARRLESERRAKEEAERARRAASSVSGSSMAAPDTPDDEDNDDSVRGILAREWRRQRSRESGMI